MDEEEVDVNTQDTEEEEVSSMWSLTCMCYIAATDFSSCREYHE